MRIKKFNFFVCFSVACLVSVRAVQDNNIWDDIVFKEALEGDSGLNSKKADESALIEADIRNAQILGET